MISETRSTGTRARAAGTARSVSASTLAASWLRRKVSGKTKTEVKDKLKGNCTPTWTRAFRPPPATRSKIAKLWRTG